MNLTPAGRYVTACLVLTTLLLAVGVLGRVASGQWDAEQVVIVVPMVTLLALMSWKWDS